MIEALPSKPTIDRELVKRGGFEKFVQLAWDQVDPHPLVWEPHMSEVCKHVEAVIRGDVYQLIVNIPPGMSKSVLCNIFAPAYAWIIDPTFRMGFFGNDIALVRRDARKCRALIESDWFQARWPMQMLDDSNKIEEFSNEFGGVRSCFTIRQQVTGHHFNMVTVDDPHKPQSFSVGEGTNEAEYAAMWFDDVLSTRFLKGAPPRIVIIMQRLAEHDLAGYVLESDRDNWEHLCLPMEATDTPVRTSIGGDWRAEGELLAPKRFPKSDVERLKRRFRSQRVASAQLQQNPIPDTGTIFLSHYFDKRYKESQLPQWSPLYLSLDCTFKDADTSDFVVGTVWSAVDGDYFLRHLIRGKWGFVDTVNQIVQLLQRFPDYSGLLIEDKANGSAIIDALTRAGVQKVIPFNPGKVSKVERAFATTPLFQDGHVHFPKDEPPWFADYLHELLSFPAGRYDDCVDSTTQALIYMSMQRGGNVVRAFRNMPRMLG